MSSTSHNTLTQSQVDSLTAFRHDMHKHPELQYEERRASDKIASYLKGLGLVMFGPGNPNAVGTIHQGLAKTGIVASIFGKGSSKGRSVGIRADIDALPVTEITGLPYASTNKGKMHACGHDGHTTMLLGAATLLVADRSFNGTVHLIFQPAEEGGAGAKKMMDEGLFTLFPCDAVFALHNWPTLPQGQMAVRAGPIMAATMRFRLTIKGKGGHAALPHTTVDPIPVACSLVTQMQTLVSRAVDPIDSAVVTIGRVDAGTTENIIPNTAVIAGTVRSLRRSTEDMLVSGIERMAKHVAEAHRCEATFERIEGYPCTTNTPKEAEFMAKVMAEVLGDAKLAHPNIDPAMTAEDFGFMLEVVPGAYGWIGNGGGSVAGCGVGLHNPSYDFNDRNIALGATFWDVLARRWLSVPASGSKL